MGTLGCINDMMRRDKENRELRKLNRDRIKEHPKYLMGKGKMWIYRRCQLCFYFYCAGFYINIFYKQTSIKAI